MSSRGEAMKHKKLVWTLAALLVMGALDLAAEPLPERPVHDERAPTADEAVGQDIESMQLALRAWHLQQQAPKRRRLEPHSGILSGMRIALSPGHGIRYDEGAWGWQRGIVQNLREDIHNAQWIIDALGPQLERAGAETIHLRALSYSPLAAIVDNDTSPDYVESGDWSTGSSEGIGGTYRYAYLDPNGTAQASWTFQVPEDGNYPVYMAFLSGSNRSPAAQVEIEHAFGVSAGVLDQSELLVESYQTVTYPNNPPPTGTTTEPSLIWRYLGSYPFKAGEDYALRLSNRGNDTEAVVIADAIRVGEGPGEVNFGGGFSGEDRWEESADTYLEWLGVPSWMKVGDVSTRPLYAIYRGVDLYFSLHTNCCDAQGTSTWVWYPDMWVGQGSWPSGFAAENLPPGTMDLANGVQDYAVAYIRQAWDPEWDNDGVIGADFGELRAIRNGWYNDVNTYGVANPMTIPAALMEVGFHDQSYDASFLREVFFRRDVARGILAGIISAEKGAGAMLPPLAPEKIWAIPQADGLHISWEAKLDAVWPNSAPTSYRIYPSPDGLLFDPAYVEATGTSALLPMEGCEPLYFKITAVNEAGESLDSVVLGGARSSLGGAMVLYVDGVDREVKLVTDPNNVRSYARSYGPGILASLDGVGFGSASDEGARAAWSGGDWAGAIWALGETSTRRGTLDADQRALITEMVGAGKALVISGAEIGWDLVERGDSETQAFFNNVLGASYINDDGGSTVIAGALVTAETVFGDCSADAACMEWPDVLGVSGTGEVLLSYGSTGGGAAVKRGDAPVLVAGFPLETVANESQRRALIGAALAELLDAGLASSGLCVEDEPLPEDEVEWVEDEHDVSTQDAVESQDIAEMEDLIEASDATEDLGSVDIGEGDEDLGELGDAAESAGEDLQPGGGDEESCACSQPRRSSDAFPWTLALIFVGLLLVRPKHR